MRKVLIGIVVGIALVVLTRDVRPCKHCGEDPKR